MNGKLCNDVREKQQSVVLGSRVLCREGGGAGGGGEGEGIGRGGEKGRKEREGERRCTVLQQ